MNNKITVVFPMAGEGQRFGNKFKPFLKIFNKTFIEMAIEPFFKHKNKISKLIFIVREDHCSQFNVNEKFKEFNIPINFVIKKIEPTKSVIETVSTLFENNKSLKNVIFCDCDHSVNVDEIFEEIENKKYDCIIPGWKITANESKKWSIASVDDNYNVKKIKEKEYPKDCNNYFGVIGCYYFRDISKPSNNLKYLSEVIDLILIERRKVKLILIKEAEFFGDPERLENLYISKRASTVFCDLDGTIIKHENTPDYTKGIELLDGAKEKIEEWRNNNAFIVLTTSRDEQFRLEMENMLRKAGIKYEYLIMGLPPGPRYLINDKKPYSDIEMAKSFEVPRNIGIKNINIGHSNAELNMKNKFIINKSIASNSSEYQLNKFKAQYNTMLAIKNLPDCYNLVPNISNFQNNQYSMEHLSGYSSLHLFSLKDRIVILNKLFYELEKLYEYRRPDYDNWLMDHIKEKIYSKETTIQKLGFSNNIVDLIQKIVDDKYDVLCPKILCSYYHGDLTYENILVENGDIKLIDFDNDNLAGCPELDLGKLMQSVLTQYEYWDNLDDESIKDINHNKLEYDCIINFYYKYLQQNIEQIEQKAYFYCALHLFRMIPYQAKTSMRRANIAYNLSKKYLEKILNK